MGKAEQIEQLGKQIVSARIQLGFLCGSNTPELDRACNQISAGIRSLNKAIARENRPKR